LLLGLLIESTALRNKLKANTNFFSAEMTTLGSNSRPGTRRRRPALPGGAAPAAKFAGTRRELNL